MNRYKRHNNHSMACCPWVLLHSAGAKARFQRSGRGLDKRDVGREVLQDFFRTAAGPSVALSDILPICIRHTSDTIFGSRPQCHPDVPPKVYPLTFLPTCPSDIPFCIPSGIPFRHTPSDIPFRHTLPPHTFDRPFWCTADDPFACFIFDSGEPFGYLSAWYSSLF